MRQAGQPVEIQGLSKRYGRLRALDDVSLAVAPGEFLALLGPSGSGKSTMLMTIAGFERADSGRIIIGGRPVDHLPPHQREIGMVFQRYALFPHMSVSENLAYPLRRRGVTEGEILRRVTEALGTVRLDDLGSRSIDALSGGQQQRVALARAIIFRPAVLLMDEPMSALDRKLRQHMQLELKQLHQELGTTIILVTHDQEEALSMADRVALLNHGRLRQVGAPAELYRRPVDAFVADFIGRTNFLSVDHSGVVGFSTPLAGALAPDSAAPAPGKVLGIRPEHMTLSDDAPGEPCRVIQASFGGAQQVLLLAAGGQQLTMELPSWNSSGGGRLWQPGEAGFLRFLPGTARVYDPLDTQETV
ncbi:ABC transporter ATP-binding protein [Roseomonas sp. 18066]|uniref:ABC transporter ATP-binding protein n=1 Tax=Roseomonas sp. 18066 TaxID=2681412 RepID=UPI00135772C3|nr:ABC transporter ATP-binding protein [Roseomonas sp. 18066]